MLTFIARMQVPDEHRDKFISLAKELREQVQANEPDTLMYEFFRGEKPGEFIVLEAFTDEAAEEAHQSTDYFKRIAPELLACLDGTYVREYFHPLESTPGD